MLKAGFTVVRMGEFAWSTLEPAEGEFRSGWLDRAIDLLSKAGIVTVLGTPTAAPPAWLVAQYPDLMAVDEGGRRVQFGNRCHYCVNSPEFRIAVRRIVAMMGERFGQNRHVIGWQLDNEYNRVCTCDRCRKLFQAHLAEQFGSLEALNTAWSTAYWSQTYSAWDQIPIPIGPHNPGLKLAFKHFVTQSYRTFQQLQLDALRPHLRPGVWVTHNFMGWFDGFDHYELAEDLDLASWDWYIGTGHHDYLGSGAAHDLTRGLKRQKFWVMETQPSCTNWSPVNNPLHKGEARVMAWQAVGHGADGVLYWQWRSALGGQEQYHGTLVDQSGQPRPFYDEAVRVGHEFRKVSELLAGSAPAARVAILNSYDSRWSIQWQRHHKDFDYVAHLQHYYRPLAIRNIPVDIISADTPLKSYRLVIVPALTIITSEQAEQLREFVRRGGSLVLTVRCGMKDEHNALLSMRQPGPLADIVPVEVEEYYALDEPVPVNGNWFSGVSERWAERLGVVDESAMAKIATYGPSNGWLDDQLAIVVSSHRTGLVYYVGTYLDEATQDAFIGRIVQTAGVRPVLETSPGVQVCRRVTKDRTDVLIAINHERTESAVVLPWAAHEHLTERTVGEQLRLGPYGVAVLTRIEA
jgi:beta-galactosidase